MAKSHSDSALQMRAVAGAAAGNITVTGIKPGDVLLGVVGFVISGGAPNNKTDEFTITAANTINNTGGTSTAGSTLFVFWWSQDSRGARLDRS